MVILFNLVIFLLIVFGLILIELGCSEDLKAKTMEKLDIKDDYKIKKATIAIDGMQGKIGVTGVIMVVVGVGLIIARIFA